MVCASSSCSNSPMKFYTSGIFWRRRPLDLSGAWTIIFFANLLTMVGVSSFCSASYAVGSFNVSFPYVVHGAVACIALAPCTAVTILHRGHVFPAAKCSLLLQSVQYTILMRQVFRTDFFVRKKFCQKKLCKKTGLAAVFFYAKILACVW